MELMGGRNRKTLVSVMTRAILQIRAIFWRKLFGKRQRVPCMASELKEFLQGFGGRCPLCLRYICNVFALITVLTGPVAADSRPDRTIVLGAIASLTGPAAEQGQNWVNGAKLAVKNLALQDGIKVNLHVEDDGSRAAAVPIAFSKLVSVYKAQAIVGGTWDYLAAAAGPAAKRLGVPFITPTNPVEIIEPITFGNRWFFTAGLSIRATEEVMQQIVGKLRPEKVASIVVHVPFGLIHAEAFERVTESLGSKMVVKETFDISGYLDSLKLLALKVSDTKPDLVLCVSDYVGLLAFTKEARRLGYHGMILTTQHLDEAAKLSRQPELWSSVVGIYPEIVGDFFANSYTLEFGERPKVYAAEGYDSVIFLARALRASIDLSRAPFRTTGVTGTLSSAPGVPDIGQLSAIPMIYRGGGLVPYF